MAQGIEYTKEEREEVVQSLKTFFLLGYSIKKACEYGGFNPQTLYTWVKNDDVLRTKINAWQGQVNSKAREAVVQSILGQEEKRNKEGEVIQEFRPPSIKSSQWWLERMEREHFSTRTELDHTSKGEAISGWKLEIIDKTEDIDAEEDTGDNSPEETTES
jgi:hypothetical protein